MRDGAVPKRKRNMQCGKEKRHANLPRGV